MKLRFTLSFLLFAWTGAIAQTTNTFPATGNAGLGTATPTSVSQYTILDIKGKSSTNGGYIRFTTADVTGEARIFNSHDRLLFDLLKDGMYFQWRGFDGKELFRLNQNGSALWRGNLSSYTEVASNTDGQYLRQFSNNGTRTSWLIRGYAHNGIQAVFNDGGIEVNGNIRAKEIKVEVANWPDYVFTDNYKILSLSELETYIGTFRHLPGMPTAVQAEQDGVDLGEMNRKLLEKVEELTLHLIEKEKNEKIILERLKKQEEEMQYIRALLE